MVKVIFTCMHPYTRFGHVVGIANVFFKLWGVPLCQVWKPLHLLKLFALIFYQRSYFFSLFLFQSIKIGAPLQILVFVPILVCHKKE